MSAEVAGVAAAQARPEYGFMLALAFGVGGHIAHMGVMALRRGILNQHVQVEFG